MLVVAGSPDSAHLVVVGSSDPAHLVVAGSPDPATGDDRRTRMARPTRPWLGVLKPLLALDSA